MAAGAQEQVGGKRRTSEARQTLAPVKPEMAE